MPQRGEGGCSAADEKDDAEEGEGDGDVFSWVVLHCAVSCGEGLLSVWIGTGFCVWCDVVGMGQDVGTMGVGFVLMVGSLLDPVPLDGVVGVPLGVKLMFDGFEGRSVSESLSG